MQYRKIAGGERGTCTVAVNEDSVPKRKNNKIGKGGKMTTMTSRRSTEAEQHQQHNIHISSNSKLLQTNNTKSSSKRGGASGCRRLIVSRRCAAAAVVGIVAFLGTVGLLTWIITVRYQQLMLLLDATTASSSKQQKNKKAAVFDTRSRRGNNSGLERSLEGGHAGGGGGEKGQALLALDREKRERDSFEWLQEHIESHYYYVSGIAQDDDSDENDQEHGDGGRHHGSNRSTDNRSKRRRRTTTTATNETRYFVEISSAAVSSRSRSFSPLSLLPPSWKGLTVILEEQKKKEQEKNGGEMATKKENENDNNTARIPSQQRVVYRGPCLRLPSGRTAEERRKWRKKQEHIARLFPGERRQRHHHFTSGDDSSSNSSTGGTFGKKGGASVSTTSVGIHAAMTVITDDDEDDFFSDQNKGENNTSTASLPHPCMNFQTLLSDWLLSTTATTPPSSPTSSTLNLLNFTETESSSMTTSSTTTRSAPFTSTSTSTATSSSTSSTVSTRNGVNRDVDLLMLDITSPDDPFLSVLRRLHLLLFTAPATTTKTTTGHHERAFVRRKDTTKRGTELQSQQQQQKFNVILIRLVVQRGGVQPDPTITNTHHYDHIPALLILLRDILVHQYGYRLAQSLPPGCMWGRDCDSVVFSKLGLDLEQRGGKRGSRRRVSAQEDQKEEGENYNDQHQLTPHHDPFSHMIPQLLAIGVDTVPELKQRERQRVLSLSSSYQHQHNDSSSTKHQQNRIIHDPHNIHHRNMNRNGGDGGDGEVKDCSFYLPPSSSSVFSLAWDPERAQLWPDNCSSDTGPTVFTPAPPIPPLPPLEAPTSSTTSTTSTTDTDTAGGASSRSRIVLHIYVKGSSSPQHMGRSEWIAGSWGRAVIAPHTLTYALDGKDKRAVQRFRKRLDKQSHEKGDEPQQAEANVGGGMRVRDQRRSQAALPPASSSATYLHKAIVVPNTDRFGEYQTSINDTSQLNRRLRHAEGFRAQRVKTRWVLRQQKHFDIADDTAAHQTQQTLHKQPESALSSWTCYFDDDVVVNITNLERDLWAKQSSPSLCHPNCWVGMVTRQPRERQCNLIMDNSSSTNNTLNPGNRNDENIILTLGKNTKKHNKMKEHGGRRKKRAVQYISESWTVGGWCMERALVRRVQQEVLPRSDAALGCAGPDDLGLSPLLRYTMGVHPTHSDRWVFAERGPSVPPSGWFRPSRRPYYAVYHQVDVPSGLFGPGVPPPPVLQQTGRVDSGSKLNTSASSSSSHTDLLMCPDATSVDMVRRRQ